MSKATSKKKSKDRTVPPPIKWPSWAVTAAPTQDKLMVCSKCNTPVWTSQHPHRSRRHSDTNCHGKLRELTPNEKKEARAALTEIIGAGKSPAI